MKYTMAAAGREALSPNMASNGGIMTYLGLYNYLKTHVNYHDSQIVLKDGLMMCNFDFSSGGASVLPGSAYIDGSASHGAGMGGLECEPRVLACVLGKDDALIEENLNFRYHLIKHAGPERARGVIIMLHGFNEKDWDKYLPWAYHIAKYTMKAVLLFPIAFHMNRAPAAWSDSRLMYKVCQLRKKYFPDVIASTLSNVAISTRLHHQPQRFVWSGMQSYRDLIDMVELIKKDKHSAIEPDATVDFFSYSVGSFLGQVVLMTNESDYFSRSRLVAFCGGPTFNRLSPVSRFILDSEGNVRLYSYLVEHLKRHMDNSESLREYLNLPHMEGLVFRSMLNYREGLVLREKKLRQFSRQIYAIALAKDEVVPPYEVTSTLRGSRMDIDIKVDVLDYPYAYRHEDPFPAASNIEAEVDRQFVSTFNLACEFFA